MGLSNEQITTVNARYPFLKPLTVPAESYPGQMEPLQTIGSFNVLLARADLPDELAYRLAKAIHKAQPELAARLVQGRDTLPQNTLQAADNLDRIHPGVDAISKRSVCNVCR